MSDATVEFQANKPLSSETLEVILLYLESAKRSGGGDIVSSSLDDSKQLLTVTFADKVTRDNLVSKRELSYSDIVLRPIEALTPEKCEKNKKVLIFTNLSQKIDLIAIELYAEHIVRNNRIESVHLSKFVPNTFYISFENDIDLDAVQARYKAHSKFLGSSVMLLEAFKTNSVIGKFENEHTESIEIMELHFTNPQKSGVNAYLQLKCIQNSFYLLRFEDEESVKGALNHEQVILKNRFLLEEYLNFDLVKVF